MKPYVIHFAKEGMAHRVIPVGPSYRLASDFAISLIREFWGYDRDTNLWNAQMVLKDHERCHIYQLEENFSKAVEEIREELKYD